MTASHRRSGAVLAGALALAACATTPQLAPTTDGGPPPDDPASVHARLLTLDTHVDIPLAFATAAVDPGRLTASQVDLPKMRAGGLDAAFFILFSEQGPLTEEGYAAARETVEIKHRAITRMTAAYPDQIVLARSAADVRRAVAEGKLVALIGMENAYPLGESVAGVETWAARGVRYVGITHFGHNQFGDSSNPDAELGDGPSRHGGLSPLGRELVAALNRAGVMVDVSHAAKTTMMDAVAVSAAPVIASHSGAKAVYDSPRNLDDEQLRAIAANGGVAQMVAFASYVKETAPGRADALAALRARYGVASDAEALALESAPDAAAYRRALAALDAEHPRATLSDFVDHIDHAVAVAGIDHVGIASDFDGGGGVTGWTDATETAAVTAELMRRGYAEADLAKIWGGNLLRVLDEVEQAGRRLRGEEE